MYKPHVLTEKEIKEHEENATDVLNHGVKWVWPKEYLNFIATVRDLQSKNTELMEALKNWYFNGNDDHTELIQFIERQLLEESLKEMKQMRSGEIPKKPLQLGKKIKVVRERTWDEEERDAWQAEFTRLKTENAALKQQVEDLIIERDEAVNHLEKIYGDLAYFLNQRGGT